MLFFMYIVSLLLFSDVNPLFWLSKRERWAGPAKKDKENGK